MMIDDRIGNIGSTHGVSESSTPAPKNAAITVQKAPDCNALSITPASVREAVLTTTGGTGVAPGALAPGFNAASPLAIPRTLPSPPKPLRLTVATLGIGG